MKISSPPPGQATVIVIDPARVPAEDAASCLVDGEHQLANRFRFERDASRWRACRAALRRILASALGIEPVAVPLVTADHGKPLLSPPYHHLHFNLSHCHDLALVALCTGGPVGVDIEAADRAPSLLGCESSFCHAREIAALPAGTPERAKALLDLWTDKEALLKAIGTGLSLAPQSVSLAPDALDLSVDRRLDKLRRHRLIHASLARHVASLAAPDSVSRITIIHLP